MPVIYALEGTVHSGKSTLLNLLRQHSSRLTTIEEYIEFAPSGFPGCPQTEAAALDAIHFFASLDQLRSPVVVQEIAILDRSVLSILAYDFAISAMFPERGCWPKCLAAVAEDKWMWPGICVYLEIDDATIFSRHQNTSGRYDDVLLDPTFNRLLRNFYEYEMNSRWPDIELLVLDGTRKPEQLSEELLQHISRLERKSNGR